MTLADEIRAASAAMASLHPAPQSGRRANPVRDAEILRRWNLGEAQVSIAKSFALHPSRVCRILKRFGAPPAPKRSAKRDAAILALWDAGRTATEIGAHIGMSLSGVQYALNSLNAPRRRVSRAVDESTRRDQMLSTLWADESITAPEIAKALGIHSGSVLKAVRRLGLPRRKRGRKPRA